MWKLSGLSITVNDLEASEYFYGRTLGLGTPKKRNDIDCVFESTHSVLRLKKPSNKLIENEGSAFKPALEKYVMLEIPDLEKVEERMRNSCPNLAAELLQIVW